LAAIAQRVDPEAIERLGAVVPKARRGNASAVRSYIRCWQRLERSVLSAFHEAAPDIVVRQADGTFLLVEAKGEASPHLTEALDQEALHAPFSVWVQALGDGPGVAVHLIAAIRRLSGQTPVRLPERLTAARVFTEASRSLEPARFLRLAYQELEADRRPIDRVSDVFELSGTELGRLFGVSRQRIGQWREEGVPVAHQRKLNDLARIADVLERNLMPERIPGIVRTVAAAFGKRTLLEQIKEGQHEEALRRVEDSFNWATTA
jgi:hypothetical protein